MARPALRFLQHELHSCLLHRLANFFRFVPNDHPNVSWRNDLLSRGNHMCQQRLATDLMQDFRMFGFEPCALARRHDCNRDPGVPLSSIHRRFH